MPAPERSVIVPTRRRAASLARLLEALEAQSGAGSFEIIVVNDGSDGPDYARALKAHPRARYLALAERGGPAAARNRGARQASGEWLVFTDDDCVPPPDWLARLRPAEGIDVVAGPVRIPGEARPSIRAFIGEDGRARCLPSANLAVRRTVFFAIGGFDERYPHAGGEDLDLTFRLVASGARTAIDEEWVLLHERPSNWAEVWSRCFRYGYGEALFRRYRGASGLPPAGSYGERAWAVLGLAARAARTDARSGAGQALSAAARQAAFEAGRLYGSWQCL